MSWSVQAVGKVAAVRADLEKQFARAKTQVAGIPQEQAACAAAEVAVNASLDYLAEARVPTAVSVVANGSAWGQGSGEQAVTRSASLNIKVETLGGFVE